MYAYYVVILFTESFLLHKVEKGNPNARFLAS
jgi:hypothetical protein